MSDDLDLVDFITWAVIHLVHTHGMSEDEATHHVLLLVRAARSEYRKAGAPLGDTDEGFLAWLMPRQQPPTA